MTINDVTMAFMIMFFDNSFSSLRSLWLKHKFLVNKRETTTMTISRGDSLSLVQLEFILELASSSVAHYYLYSNRY